MIADPGLSSPIKQQLASVGGTHMAYREVGEGDPILFLHGNPMSSYLWRNIMVQLQDVGRCIAPDLIGMGGSGRLAGDDYRYSTHQHYLDAFCEALGLDRDVIVVGHDWGGALGFDWARKHPEAVQGIAYGETLVHPTVGNEPPERAELIRFCRSSDGESAILHGDFLLDVFMKASTLRPLPPEVEQEYRKPWLAEGESRRPMLTWVQQVPLSGEPEDVFTSIGQYSQWLSSSAIPKLLIVSTQGQLSGPNLAYCRSWPNQSEVVVEAKHFFQEDAPAAVGAALRDWALRLRSPAGQR
ncbi:haloalkane dehalogenase [Mycolicibacterium sp. OfavD-34-C]|uniref:haloalkane dehalogenase n=1 Tax=Mycolicibacterium sp. OfavD-34-C TaxID=2917746 RepID=UPI001EF5CE2E|nr:haloalkane dehalogenase [Mycolicibacterium sp. OfavD-34-C]MCG7578664.1 haloalkane dehalogenase [Mycolicibacterium sp. OfavD-34-C]